MRARRPGTALAPLLALTLALCTASSARADRPLHWTHITAAVGAIVSGDLTGAVVTLVDAREADDTPYVDALVGLAALARGRVKDARRMFFRAAAAGSTEPLVFYWAARAAYEDRDLKEALKWVELGRAAGGHTPVLLMGRALFLRAAGRHAAASDALVQLARLNPNLLDPSLYPTPAQGAVDLLALALHDLPDKPRLMRTQGHLYWRLGQVLAALRRFDALLAQSPKDPGALQMRARCLRALGRPAAEALAVAKRAVTLAPGHALARATHGELLLAAGKPDEAVVELKRAADLRPGDATLLAQLGDACAAAHQLDCALRFYGYAVRRDPRLANAQLGFALALQKKGRLKSAWRAAQRAVILDPVNPECHQTLAHLARLHKKDRVAATWQRSARRIEAVQRGAQRREARNRKVISAMDRALDACACGPSCAASTASAPACAKAVRALPATVRSLFAAHLALVRGKPGTARARLARLPRALSPRRLLAGDLQVLVRTVNLKGSRYEVRTVLPMASPDRFGAAN